VLLARLADRGRDELVSVLGPKRGRAVAELLEREAAAWAREVGAAEPLVSRSAADLGQEVSRMAADGDRPVAVVWPALVRPRADLKAAILDDLAAGCDVVFGPLVDGGLYLLGFQRPLPLVATLLEGRVTPDGFAAALSMAADSGLEIGYLRPERSLASRDGVALALADPLTPEPTRSLLRNPA
jgi:glycosyltransferase A (GT-A) superfamily protein (DUF2064 family)